MPRNFAIDNEDQYKDFFNLVAGELLGQGIHRKVFECRLNPDYVIKCEQDHSTFANVREWTIWDDCRWYKPVAQWLAPCIDISPNGLTLIQRKVIPFREGDPMPEKVPGWMMDVKPQNFGWLVIDGERRPVLHDYTQQNTNLSKKLVTADWSF